MVPGIVQLTEERQYPNVFSGDQLDSGLCLILLNVLPEFKGLPHYLSKGISVEDGP